jgi:hypothetical protein
MNAVDMNSTTAATGLASAFDAATSASSALSNIQTALQLIT